MDRNLILYLPLFLQNIKEYIAILQTAEQPEISQLWGDLDTALNDQFLSTSPVYGVSRWEKILGIIPKGTETIDDRKFRILSYLSEKRPYTIRSLQATLDNLFGSGNVKLKVENDVYNLNVSVNNLDRTKSEELNKMLRKIIPANMGFMVQILFESRGNLFFGGICSTVEIRKAEV
jgi:hypothetical protein